MNHLLPEMHWVLLGYEPSFSWTQTLPRWLDRARLLRQSVADPMAMVARTLGLGVQGFANHVAAAKGYSHAEQPLAWVGAMDWLADWQDVRCARVQMDLTSEHRQRLSKVLAPVFADHGLLCWQLEHQLWVTAKPGKLDASVRDPWSMIGCSMREVLDASPLSGFYHDAQLALHREDLPCNGVWCWGGGERQALVPPLPGVIYTDDAFLTNCAQTTGRLVEPSDALLDARPCVGQQVHWWMTPDNQGLHPFERYQTQAKALLARPWRSLVVHVGTRRYHYLTEHARVWDALLA